MSPDTSRFEILKEQRREDYKTWKPIYCAAINEHVFFNARGFEHLNFKIDNTPRNPKEILFKLNLLPLVRSVIYRAKRIQEQRKRFAPIGGSNRKVFKEIEYWGITGIVGKRKTRVRVILRRIGTGNIHFWSVMKLS